MLKQSSNVYDMTKTSYMNNKEKTMGQNKSYEGLNFSTHFQQDNLNSRACNKDNESTNNYSHSSCNSTLKVNPVLATSCNVVGVNLDNCKNDHNSMNTKRDVKAAQHLKFQYHDFEVEGTFREEFNYTSFHVRPPCLQTAKVVLPQFHPVSLISDHSNSIFYCETELSSHSLDQNNNKIVTISSHYTENSNMASHLTYTQRFASFCELTESTINTLNFGKRKAQSSSVCENLIYNQNELSTSVKNNVEKHNTNGSQSYKSCVTNNNHDNEVTLKRDDKLRYQNGFQTSNEESEESDSDWEYYSDDELVIGPTNLTTSECYKKDEKPKRISFPINSNRNTFYMRHPALNTRSEKGTKDPWSPYLKNITFDINNDRDSKTSIEIKALNNWIEDVSNVEKSNILMDMNNYYHQQYPLCTTNKNGLTNIITSKEKQKEKWNKDRRQEQEQKEGTFIEYVEDDKSDDFSEMHIVNYCNGVLHGFYRIFTASSNNRGNEFTQFHSIGRFMKGKKVGMSWKWLEGNCYFLNLDEEKDDNIPRDGYYFYPNLSCGIQGKYKIIIYLD